MAASRCCQGVFLIITAMLMFCEAHFQQNTRQQSYYYQDARMQRPESDVMQQGYYSQVRDARIKQLMQRPDAGAIEQGYYYEDIQNEQLVPEPSVMEQSYYYQDAQSQQRPVKFNVNMGRELSAEAIQQQQPEAEQQSLSCLFQIQTRSKSTTICIQADRICTQNVSVPACSSSASSCKMIGENNPFIKRFISLHPEVYADECLDTSGALCFYTDVKYHKTCSTASTTGRTTFCVLLTDGIERCSNLVDLIVPAAKEEVSTVIKPFKPAA